MNVTPDAAQAHSGSRDFSLRKVNNPALDEHGRLKFVAWLYALEESSRLLVCSARTPQMLELGRSMLRQWQEAGYPDPGDWPVPFVEYPESAPYDLLEESCKRLMQVLARPDSSGYSNQPAL